MLNIVNFPFICKYNPESNRYAVTSSFCFVASIKQIWSNLLNWGSIVLFSDNDRANALNLMNMVKKNQINIIDVVPSLLDIIVREWNNAPVNWWQSINIICTGGELLLWSLIKQIQRLSNGQIRCINIYGATETGGVAAIYSTHQESDSSNDVLSSSSINNNDDNVDMYVPAGKCLPGIQINILREDGSKCNINEIGFVEICGPRLSIPYNKFNPSMLIPINSKIIGDLGKIDENGILHIIGRGDDVVKIRGMK
jgi:acyl-coenzyme A synthetase/AMP-(fatty) acid ligase